MSATDLHDAIRNRDGTRIQRLIAAGADLEARDHAGYTALMRAVTMRSVDTRQVDALLAAGARVDASVPSYYGSPRSVLSLAVETGSPAIAASLIRAGAEVGYVRDGFDVLLDALHGRRIRADAELLALLQVLLAAGARLDQKSSYGETALRVLSNWARFDGVALLLAAGADARELQWTPLMRATAIGSLDEMRRLLQDANPELEARDVWLRTAWLIAVVGGDTDKAALLREHGADTQACGKCGATPLQHAVRSGNPAMVRRLLDDGAPLDRVDELGDSALMDAAESGELAIVELLLDAGAAVDLEKVWTAARDETIPQAIVDAMAGARGSAALENSTDPSVIRRLLQAGADPQQLGTEGRRAMLGLPGEHDIRLLEVDGDAFLQGRHRRFGARNPERMDDPFWLGMIRSGVDAWSAGQKYGATAGIGSAPIWCARRHGQSLTELPDGRIVQVGGEHEDFYDPDFCIYNDVFVHAPDGSIAIYGYPQNVFPPTDFHTATLVGDTIWLIGSLGYHGKRRAGFTPVYTLDTRSFRIDAIATHGDPPGWIYRHRAILRNGSEIVIQGGCVHGGDESRRDAPPAATHVLDLRTRRWRREPAPE